MSAVHIIFIYYLPVAQTRIQRRETDDQLMNGWAAILTESKVSKFCGCLKYIFQRVGLR